MTEAVLQWEWENILAQEWLWDIDTKEWFGSIDVWDFLKQCSGVCSDCVGTLIEGTQIMMNAIICCGSHPETREVSDHWTCPELSIDTGLCQVYNTSDYPLACRNYHCKTYGV